MAEDLVVGGTTHEGVEAVEFKNTAGETVTYTVGGTDDFFAWVEWDSIKNKPFGEGERVTLVYDESKLDETMEMLKYDAPEDIDIEYLFGATVVGFIDDVEHTITVRSEIYDGSEFYDEFYIAEDEMVIVDMSSLLGIDGVYVLGHSKINATYIFTTDVPSYGSKGIYFPTKVENTTTETGDDGTETTVTTYTWIESITYKPFTKIPKIYLPDSVGYSIKGKYTDGELIASIPLEILNSEFPITAVENSLVSGQLYRIHVTNAPTVIETTANFDGSGALNIGGESYGFTVITAPYEETVLASLTVSDSALALSSFGVTDSSFDITAETLIIYKAEEDVYKTPSKYISTKSTAVVLTADNWSGEIPPYTQEVTVSGIDANTFGVVGVADTATADEYTVASKAQLRKTAQGKDTLTFSAYGAKPSIDIPITISGLWD